MNQVSEFYKELSSIIEKNEDRFLSLGVDISRSTLWRWKGGVNTNYPNPEMVLNFLIKLSGLKTVSEIANYYGGNVNSFLRESYPITFEDSYKSKLSNSATSFIDDFYSYVVFTLAGTTRGIKENELIYIIGKISAKKAGLDSVDITDDVVRAHGIIAIKKIKYLVDANIISLDENGCYQRTEKCIHIDISTAQNFLPEIITNLLKPEEFSKGYNAIFAKTETISPQLAHEIAIETKEFFLKMNKKMDDGQCSNGIPYTILNFAERFWFDGSDDSVKGSVKQ